MGTPRQTSARRLADQAVRQINEVLKSLLAGAGVRKVERRIGRSDRFFQKARERDALRLSDYLATCATLGRDPADLLRQALGGGSEPEIRPPRIVSVARDRLDAAGGGIGDERLAELDAAVQVQPARTRAVLSQELERAHREEVPRILGLYGTCLRVEADLAHAEVVLREARDMATSLDLMAVQADLLIRSSYVALEQDRVSQALAMAEQATLAYGRIENREGEGQGYLTMGMIRYYNRDHRQAITDLKGVLRRPMCSVDLFSAFQCCASCWVALGDRRKARREAKQARELASQVPPWLVAKLDWLESRLAQGSARLELLKRARSVLCPTRAADCALVTVELAEHALELKRDDLAEREIIRLCALLDRKPGPRIENAVLHLVNHRTRLTPRLIGNVRRALDRALSRRPFSLPALKSVSLK